ncbi:hypothetical protein [Rhodococcus oryzae]|uniref:hypothetical protein n=1 Tax=Rhodococcus oryzae TaxID=2571143 RepID=UPI003797FE9F
MATATMVGAPVDLEQAEMLITSLLIQAARPMSKPSRLGRRRRRLAAMPMQLATA